MKKFKKLKRKHVFSLLLMVMMMIMMMFVHRYETRHGNVDYVSEREVVPLDDDYDNECHCS